MIPDWAGHDMALVTSVTNAYLTGSELNDEASAIRPWPFRLLCQAGLLTLQNPSSQLCRHIFFCHPFPVLNAVCGDDMHGVRFAPHNVS